MNKKNLPLPAKKYTCFSYYPLKPDFNFQLKNHNTEPEVYHSCLLENFSQTNIFRQYKEISSTSQKASDNRMLHTPKNRQNIDASNNQERSKTPNSREKVQKILSKDKLYFGKSAYNYHHRKSPIKNYLTRLRESKEDKQLIIIDQTQPQATHQKKSNHIQEIQDILFTLKKMV